MKIGMSLFTIALAAAAIPAQAGNPATRNLPRASREAPSEMSARSYQRWVSPILRSTGIGQPSAFTENVFEWYEQEKDRDLPSRVDRSRNDVYVDVRSPLRETDRMERSGDIETGNTVGAEVYAELDGTVEDGLEAMLFGWGKPVGEKEGMTYPEPGIFTRHVEFFAPYRAWGSNAYANYSKKTGGGIVKDLTDRYLMLIYGDKDKGYDIVMQLVKAEGESASQNCIAIAILRPGKNGTFTYKISTRYQGQSYKVLGGVEKGRAEAGFNQQKVLDVFLDYKSRVKELRETGGIRSKRK